MNQPDDLRKQRLAQALRDNLRRRKAQARDQGPDAPRDPAALPHAEPKD